MCVDCFGSLATNFCRRLVTGTNRTQTVNHAPEDSAYACLHQHFDHRLSHGCTGNASGNTTLSDCMSRGELNVHQMCSVCDLGRATESEEDNGHIKKHRHHVPPACSRRRHDVPNHAPDRVPSSTSQTMGYLLILLFMLASLR